MKRPLIPSYDLFSGVTIGRGVISCVGNVQLICVSLFSHDMQKAGFLMMGLFMKGQECHHSMNFKGKFCLPPIYTMFPAATAATFQATVDETG